MSQPVSPPTSSDKVLWGEGGCWESECTTGEQRKRGLAGVNLSIPGTEPELPRNQAGSGHHPDGAHAHVPGEKGRPWAWPPALPHTGPAAESPRTSTFSSVKWT